MKEGERRSRHIHCCKLTWHWCLLVVDSAHWRIMPLFQFLVRMKVHMWFNFLPVIKPMDHHHYLTALRGFTPTAHNHEENLHHGQLKPAILFHTGNIISQCGYQLSKYVNTSRMMMMMMIRPISIILSNSILHSTFWCVYTKDATWCLRGERMVMSQRGTEEACARVPRHLGPKSQTQIVTSFYIPIIALSHFSQPSFLKILTSNFPVVQSDLLIPFKLCEYVKESACEKGWELEGEVEVEGEGLTSEPKREVRHSGRFPVDAKGYFIRWHPSTPLDFLLVFLCSVECSLSLPKFTILALNTLTSYPMTPTKLNWVVHQS